METGKKLSLADIFVGLRDPRPVSKVEHDLVEWRAVAVRGVLAGADTFVEIEAWAKDEVVALDGKTSRRSGKEDATPLHLVSAFAAGAGLILGQQATAKKSNEKTAIPELLATLAWEGCIVTIDAMGTQPNIVQAIRDKGADDVLAVKDNQPRLAGRCETSSTLSGQRLRLHRIASTKSSRRITAAWKSGAAMPSNNSNACTLLSAGLACARLP